MSEITPNTPNPVREDAYKQQLAAKLGIDPQYIPGSPIWHSEEEIAAIAEMFSNMAGGGSGGGVLVVTNNDGTLDKTWQEIHDAPLAAVKDGPNTYIVILADVMINVQSGNKTYRVQIMDDSYATTDSPSGYPVYTE